MDGCIYLSIYLVAVKFVPKYILGPNVNNIMFKILPSNFFVDEIWKINWFCLYKLQPCNSHLTIPGGFVVCSLGFSM